MLVAICRIMKGKSPFTPRFSGFGEAPAGWLTPVREGLPVGVVDQAVTSGRVTLAEIDRLVLPRKTLDHRRKLGTLTPDQSDRISRLLRVVEEAEAMFGDADKAHRWLRRPSTLLDNEAPLDRLDTDIGTRQVEAILGRIAHGVAA
jgi:putative toxin-antitoxin system antitoxin component (TIGR02293 family)